MCASVRLCVCGWGRWGWVRFYGLGYISLGCVVGRIVDCVVDYVATPVRSGVV